MKKLVTIILGMLALAIIYPSQGFAQKEKTEKKKKEKKEWTWEMPELTGNKEFDDYLKLCDTLNWRIQSYTDSITFYHVVKIRQTNPETGELLVDEVGNPIEEIRVIEGDPEGEYNMRGTKEALAQNAAIIMTGMNILLDAALVTTSTANATLALPSLGLKALSYAKYVKAGPKMASYALKEIKELNELCKEQRKQIRAIKKLQDGYANSEEAEDVKISTSKLEEIGITDVATVVMPSDVYQKEKEAADLADSQLPDNADDEIELDDA